jgi:hypothetical protein
MYDLDGTPKELLTHTNPKVLKGEKLGYATAIMHLSPHKASGVMNVCSHASPGCIDACLNTAGHGGMGLDADGLNKVQAARIRRTRFFKTHKAEFMEMLIKEISNHVARSIKTGRIPAVRLNGTSDLPWENIKVGDAANIMELFPNVQFYDYTKVPVKLRRKVKDVANYSLSFSLSEENDSHAKEAIEAGLNLVVVFATRRNHDLPKTFWGAPVLDGDSTDLRFLDPSGLIIGLRAKGKGIHDKSGFVRQP